MGPIETINGIDYTLKSTLESYDEGLFYHENNGIINKDTE